MTVSPHKPLPVDYLDLRHRTMNENGIHIIYPMGRDRALPETGPFNMYEGLTLRVIGYVMDSAKNYEYAVGQGGGFALMKFDASRHALAYEKPVSGYAKGYSGSDTYHYGDYYSFALRAANDSYRGDSYQMYEFEYKHSAVAFPWYGAKHWEIIQHRGYVHLSKHFYDWPPADFPTSTGLDPYLEPFVTMEVGTLAHFSGIYNGPDEIRIISTGGVKDLGRPVNSGVTIRIAVRKTLNNFTFFADYNTQPVVGSYRDLVTSGHNYLPRFSMNFNIRHVYMEVYT